MAFYKMQQGQNEFYFQLANLEVNEDYILWRDNRPVRESVAGLSPKDIYFLPREVFERDFQGYRRDRQFIRDIIVNDASGAPQQYAFGFKKRDNDQLKDEVSKIMHQLRKDPLDFSFKFRKTGTGKDTIRVVIAMNEVGKPQGVVSSPLQPQRPPIVTPSSSQESPSMASRLSLALSVAPTLTLNDKEKQVLDLFNAHVDYFSEEQFVQVFNATLQKHFNMLLMPDKIKQIYKVYYKK